MTDELQTGDTLGTYRLGERLGGGGFGAVWKATDQATGRVVALKTLRTDVYSLDTMKLRSEVELLAGSASSVSKHVVKVLGGGVDPRPYVVMEYVDGVDLGRELERRRRIPQRETIRIGREVAEALAALKDVGIIHRDVKPSNIMIDLDGVTKLTDFGIAKIVGFDTITATSQMPMTQAYAAPEVWEGKASHRSDLYALGCVLFQCLAGRPPFTGSIAELYRGHSTREPDWTLLPEGTVQSLRDLLRECLAKAEDDRPVDARKVEALLGVAEQELSARLAGPSATDLPVHEPQAFGPWLRREKHPTQGWAFLCIHETTGEKATVEIHFSDDIEYGARLRKAVEVNPKLVPLGAERLLGTNRLVLRPSEAWTSSPAGQFQFWLAREELPLRPAPDSVDDALLSKASSALAALTSAAKDAGLDLRLPPAHLRLQRDGSVMLQRPGLATAGDDGMSWLRSLQLDGPARTSVVNARELDELVAAYTVRAGVANVGTATSPELEESATATVGRLSSLAEPRRIEPTRPESPAALTPPPPAIHQNVVTDPPAPSLPLQPEGREQLRDEASRLRRKYRLYIAQAIAFFVLVPLGVWFLISVTREGQTASPGGETPTRAATNLVVVPTSTPTVSARPQVTVAWSADDELQDPRIRFALAKVVSDAELVWDPADFGNNGPPDARYAPLEASKLLAAAGYDSGKASDGRKIAVTILYAQSTEAVAASMASSWRVLGLTVETAPKLQSRLEVVGRLEAVEPVAQPTPAPISKPTPTATPTRTPNLLPPPMGFGASWHFCQPGECPGNTGNTVLNFSWSDYQSAGFTTVLMIVGNTDYSFIGASPIQSLGFSWRTSFSTGINLPVCFAAFAYDYYPDNASVNGFWFDRNQVATRLSNTVCTTIP